MSQGIPSVGIGNRFYGCRSPANPEMTSCIGDSERSMCCHGNGHTLPESIWFTSHHYLRIVTSVSGEKKKKRRTLPDPSFSLSLLHFGSVVPFHQNKPLPLGTALAWCGLSGPEPRLYHNTILLGLVSIIPGKDENHKLKASLGNLARLRFKKNKRKRVGDIAQWQRACLS